MVKARGMGQQIVDTIVLPEWLVAGTTGAGAGGTDAGHQTAAAAAAAPRADNQDAILEQLDDELQVIKLQASTGNSSSSSSSGATRQSQTVVRVVSKPLPAVKKGRLAEYAELPVLGAQQQQVATLRLDRCSEYPLCATMVTNKVAGSYTPTKRQQAMLDRRAPPVVLLAALLLLQEDDNWQQQHQRETASANTDSAQNCQLVLPAAQVAQCTFKRFLEQVAASRTPNSSSASSSSNSAAALPAELVQWEPWEVCESLRGNPRFVYHGPLPAALAAAASNSGIPAVVFDGYGHAAMFAQTGKLPSANYLTQKKHKDLLLSVSHRQSEGVCLPADDSVYPGATHHAGRKLGTTAALG